MTPSQLSTCRANTSRQVEALYGTLWKLVYLREVSREIELSDAAKALLAQARAEVMGVCGEA